MAATMIAWLQAALPALLGLIAKYWQPLSVIGGWAVALYVLRTTLRRNHKHAERLFRKQAEYACYTRLATSLAGLGGRACQLSVTLGSLAHELESALAEEDTILTLKAEGHVADSSPKLQVHCSFAEMARKRWRERQDELFSQTQALRDAETDFGQEFEHHEVFFAPLEKPKEDLGGFTLRLADEVGNLADGLFANISHDPPFPSKENSGALRTEAKRLSREALNAMAFATQLSRLFQNQVLSDLAGRALAHPKVAKPEVIVMTKNGLCRADVAGLYDPKSAVRAAELKAKGPAAMYENLPTNNPRMPPSD